MSRQDWERFHTVVMADMALQAQLWEVDDLDALVRLAVELGRARGCEISRDDALEVMRERDREWFAERSAR